jgi:hypothetical protein
VFQTPSSAAAKIPDQSKERYKALWRWHFYAGIYVIPFLLMLSLTGLIMMWYQPVIEPLSYPGQTKVTPIGYTQPFSLQQTAVEQAYPDARVTQLITPQTADAPTRFLMKDSEGTNWLASVDPYSLTVLGRHNKDDTWYALADEIHGTFLLDSVGDAMIEIATGLMLVLLLTGLWMWWQKPGRVGRWKVDFALSGRALWRDLHSKVGAYTSIILLLFAEVFRNVESDLLRIAAIMKHPSFEEEAEWRVVSPIVTDFKDPSVHFRVGAHMLVPYFKFSLVAPKQERPKFQHLFLGPTPNSSSSLNSLRMYLAKNGVSPVRGITYCQIPYRQR